MGDKNGIETYLPKCVSKEVPSLGTLYVGVVPYALLPKEFIRSEVPLSTSGARGVFAICEDKNGNLSIKSLPEEVITSSVDKDKTIDWDMRLNAAEKLFP